MSIAGRHGKISGESGPGCLGSWDHIEDLLTADVFGALSYLPPQLVLVPALLKAKTAEGTTLERWLENQKVDPTTLTGATIVLWPELAGHEPDCFIELGPIGGPPAVNVLIEAKFRSGQHKIYGRRQVGWTASKFAQASQLGGRAPEFVPRRQVECGGVTPEPARRASRTMRRSRCIVLETPHVSWSQRSEKWPETCEMRLRR